MSKQEASQMKRMSWYLIICQQTFISYNLLYMYPDINIALALDLPFIPLIWHWKKKVEVITSQGPMTDMAAPQLQATTVVPWFSDSIYTHILAIIGIKNGQK